jgi:hypothetical protein
MIANALYWGRMREALPAVLALLLAGSGSAFAQPKEERPAGRLVGSSGWRVTEPVGFTLESESGETLLWRRQQSPPIGRPAPGIDLRQAETESIQVWHEAPRRANQCDPASSGKPVIEGSHYDKPTESFECAIPGSAPMHFYTVRLGESALRMSYSHTWSLPVDQQGRTWAQFKRPPRFPLPNLKLFRQMQGTLAPTKEALAQASAPAPAATPPAASAAPEPSVPVIPLMAGAQEKFAPRTSGGPLAAEIPAPTAAPAASEAPARAPRAESGAGLSAPLLLALILAAALASAAWFVLKRR